ncbi:hypothetical protein [Pelolinea submarina]|uniref:Uncharacterized protein n=1 Tax=Pelolinea submarina TaxID=913107 RepID=A0A347ZWN9_9CHLR|nr:hypothetical protein [Pelolinea submarina]REG05463.1 hypothetical protein DFR64_2864 [Pelolinea submarina]BBB49720.1 hypothetical protein Pelsub_P2951 [Pelolinea submarina]
MSSSDFSKKDRAEVMQLYHSDGGLDLIAGAVLLNFGLDILNQTSATSLFTWIPILLISSLKNRFTLPRLGLKALKANEKIAHSWTIQTAVGLAIWLLIISTMIMLDPFDMQVKLGTIGQGDVRNLIIGVVGGLLFAAAGWLIPLRRFYIYSGVLALSSLISYFLVPVQVPVFLIAVVMIAVGIKLTIAFGKKYPDPDKDNKDSSKGNKK